MNSNVSTLPATHHAPSTWKLTLGYALMLAVAVALFLVVRHYGERLTPVAATNEAAASTAVAAKSDILLHVLGGTGRDPAPGPLAWESLFVHFGQPRVIGEIVAGIMLGPSLLGWISPAAMNFVLPKEVGPFLGIIAQIGVILYMFLVGLDFNAGLLRSRAHATIAISHASIVAPFLLGAVLALWLYPHLAASDVPFTSFALFMGVAMSITAFPVLARILTDRHIENTELGVVALSCAAADDVTAWCLLAFVVGVAQAKLGGAVQTVIFAMLFIAFMFAVIRPLANRFLGHDAEKQPSRRMAVWVLVALLLSALAAEWIGIHAIFGAFLFGAIIPHDSDVALDFRHKLEDIVKILLLPAFFAYTGMRTQDRPRGRRPRPGSSRAVIILVATLGKFGGSLARRPLHRPRLASLGVARHPHEHPRTDGADRAQHRPRAGRHSPRRSSR